MNDHDFGSYPSFEIDFPHKFACVSDDLFLDDDDCDDDEADLSNEFDDWKEKADKVETDYSEKFNQ